MDYFYQEARVPPVCVGQGHEHEHEHAPESDPEPVISCMLVGDGAVGKTSMIISYTSNGYPTDYKQTAFDVFSGKNLRSGTLLTSHTRPQTPPLQICTFTPFSFLSLGQVQVDGAPVRIQLMDTAGQVRILCWVRARALFKSQDFNFLLLTELEIETQANTWYT